MGVLFCFQGTSIISSLLHPLQYALLYIFSEINTYLYDYELPSISLPRVTININKKRSILPDGNALEN